MKNWLIQKLGGIPESDYKIDIKRSFENGRLFGKNELKNVIISVRGDIENSGQILSFMGGFIDYICVKIGIPKIYNDGSYEKFIEKI